MLTSPYNFVPLAEKVYYPSSWSDQVSQDKPFSDGEDGIIEIEIENETPLFVRNGSKKDYKDVFSAHVLDEKGNRWFFIPGSTLKGCFRSVLEILSFSKMERFNDDSFGYRSFTTQIHGLPRYMDSMRGVSCGWLVKEGDTYLLKECVKGIQKIRHYDILKSFFKDFFPGEDHATFEPKARSLGQDTLFPEISISEGSISYKENNQEKTVPAGSYRLVTTGYMEGKRVEYLFSVEQKNAIAVSPKIINRFETIHKYTPSYGGQNGKNGLLKGMLHKGEEIPVFFKKSPNGEVESIGVTRMYKFPFISSVKDAVMNGFSEDEQKKMSQMDLPETIFGKVGDTSLKGRVQIGHAMMQGGVDEDNLVSFKSVLGQPRASYYPLYIRQNSPITTINNYSTNNTRIAGRKRYRIINRGTLGPIVGDNENVMTSLLALPQKQIFRCRIAVHNLRKIEIGAILSSITFNKTKGTFHNIGQAKSFGFGKINCRVVSLKGFSHTEDEYLSAFNEEMSFFLQTQCQTTLSKEEGLKMLVSIASDTHTDMDMKQMSLDEYEENKQENTFCPLRETHKEFNVLVDERSIIKRHNLVHYDKKIKIIKILKEKDSLESIETAIKNCHELKLFCLTNSIPVQDIDHLCSECETKKSEIEECNRRINSLCRDIDLLLLETNPLLYGKKHILSKLEEATQKCQNIPDEDSRKVAYLTKIDEIKDSLIDSPIVPLSEHIVKVSSPEVVFNQIKNWKGDSFEDEIQIIAERLIESFVEKKMKNREIQGWIDENRFDSKWKKLIDAIGPILAHRVFVIVQQNYR